VTGLTDVTLSLSRIARIFAGSAMMSPRTKDEKDFVTTNLSIIVMYLTESDLAVDGSGAKQHGWQIHRRYCRVFDTIDEVSAIQQGVLRLVRGRGVSIAHACGRPVGQGQKGTLINREIDGGRE
jgi:hypothetical protein